MKALRNILDKAKPHFSEGGKYQSFRSTFDAFETFLFVPSHTSKSGVHIHDANDMKRTMVIMVLALMPTFFFGLWNAGHYYFLSHGASSSFGENILFGLSQILPIVIVSYVVGLGIEFAVAQLRGHEVNEGFLVTGLLIPLVLPVGIPLWMVAIATAFAVVIGKEIFGGTGMNIWNPALVARAFLFFAYPSKMSGDFVWISGLLDGEGVVDGFSGATPLGVAAAGNITKFSLADSFWGFIPGSIGETSTFAILIGAALLIYTGVASWKIMVSTFAGGFIMAWVFNLMGHTPLMQMPALHHLCLGGFAFGAVFMATDPVSGTRTELGKWIYGFLIGLFAILIRVFNPAYPEGMMLSILLLNTFAPLIDYFVVQRNISKRLNRVKVKKESHS